MTDAKDDAAAPHVRMSPGKGLVVLAGVVVGVAAFLGIGAALKLESLFAGFLFAFYWSGVQHGNPQDLPASVLGALGGLFVAYLLHALPPLLGGGGLAIALGLILLAIYCLVMGWVPVLVNNSFMLFLTVGTIPVVSALNAFLDMGAAVLLAAALLGGLLLVAGVITRNRAARHAA